MPHCLGDLSGQRAKSAAVSRGSNACTGARALNQATASASGTRSTVAHNLAWVRQRDHLPRAARPEFDRAFQVVLRRALAVTDGARGRK